MRTSGRTARFSRWISLTSIGFATAEAIPFLLVALATETDFRKLLIPFLFFKCFQFRPWPWGWFGAAY
jgi:hypothetical protein